MIEDVFAMGSAPQGAEGAGGAGFLLQMFPFLLMFLILYFLLIRPQQKRQREHQEMLDDLKNGDRIVTSGGILGTITGIKAEVLTIRIADNVKIEVQRSAISKIVSKKGE